MSHCSNNRVLFLFCGDVDISCPKVPVYWEPSFLSWQGVFSPYFKQFSNEILYFKTKKKKSFLKIAFTYLWRLNILKCTKKMIIYFLSRASLVAQTVRNLPAMQETGFDPWVRKISCRRSWQPTPVFLPGEFHGQRSLVAYSPWGCKESDRIERLTYKYMFFPTKQN